MKNNFYRLLLLLPLLTAWGARAQAPVWQNAYGVPGSVVLGTATNSTGDIFVTGSFNGAVNFGGTTLTSLGDEDMFLAKWNGISNSWAWAVRGGGFLPDQGNAIAVNGANVYVTGWYTSGANARFGSLSTTFSGAGGQDVFVAKFVDGGTSVTTGSVVSAGGASGDQGRAIAVNGSTVYVTGYVNGTATFGSTALTPVYGLQDLFVAKYTDSGTALVYGSAVRSGGADIDRGNAIAVNGANVYVAGEFRSLTAVFGSTTLTNTNTDAANLSYDAFLAKFTDSGTLAQATAVKAGGNAASGSTPNEYGNGIAVNGTTLYATGTFNSTSVSFGNGVTLTNTDNTGANSDMYLAKYTDSGTLTANAATKSTNSGSDSGEAVAVSGSTVYVSGNFGGSVTYGPSALTSLGGQDAFVARFSEASNVFTVNGAVAGGSTLDDNAGSLAISGTQAVVAGYLNPTQAATFGASSIAAGNGGFLARVGTASTTVVSIVPAGASPTNAASVTFTVAFASSVTGISVGNFTTSNGGGVTGSSVSSVSGSGTTYTVTVNTGSGSGTLGLTLANDTGLTPSVSNEPFTGTPLYTIDKVAPTVTISSTASNPTSTSPIPFTITFSESVTGFVAGDVTVSNGTITGGLVNGSGSTYTFSVTPSGNGLVTVNVAANVAQDAAGNGNTTATQYSLTYQQPASATAQNVTVNLAANGTATLNATSVNNGSTGSGTLTYTIQKIVFGRASENSTLTLNTPNGANFNAIRFASYGTPVDNGNGNYGLGSCNAANSVATATNSYVGRSTGSMDANNAATANNNPTLGDPCSGTPKFLAVQVGYSADAASLSYDCTEANKTQYVLLTVTDANGSTSTSVARVTVNPPPTATLTALNPTSATPGSPVTATGTNLSGATGLTVGGAAATISNLTATGFTFVVPAGAASGNVVLTLPCSQTLTAPFTVQTAAPVVTVPATGDYVNTATPAFSGTAPAGSTVTVYVDATPIGTTTAPGGNWSLTQPTALAQGSHTVRATAQLSGQAVSGNSNTNNFIVDSVRPTVAISSTAGTSGSNTSTSPIPFTVTFSENVTGFVAGDVTVSNGTITGGIVNGSGSTYTFTVTPAGNGAVTVDVPANVAQDLALNFNTAAPQFTLTYTAPVTAVTWNGTISTDWYTAGNWTPNVVPTASLDATVPGSAPNQPFIGAGTAFALNLALNSGATLTQTGGTLTINANLTNNGTFRPSGGTVVLGTIFQSNGPNLLGSSAVRFWDLTVNSNGVLLSTSAGASVQHLLTLNGALVTQANTFTLESNATSTALVVNNSGGFVFGTATVQRYIDPSLNAGPGYRHYSSPVVSTTVADLATSTFAPVVNPAYNAVGNTVTPFPTVYGYDEGRVNATNATTQSFDQGFFSPGALSDQLTVGRGYTVNIDAASKVDLVGALNNGTVGVGALSRGTGANSGWHLLGNPYPAPLDWSVARNSLPAGVIDAVYVFKSSSQYAGTYQFYQNGFGTLPNGLIGSMQGFFVRVSQNVPAFSFLNTWRSTTYQNPTFNRTTTDTRPSVQLELMSAQGARDAAFVYFEQGATSGLDDHYDAAKLLNTTGLNLASVAAGHNLAVNGLPPMGSTSLTVPLSIGLPTTGTYTLHAAQLLNFAAGAQPFLRDLQLNTLTDLSLHPDYAFTMNAANTTPRFELVFGPAQVLGTASAALAAQVAVFPNPASKAVFVELPAALGRKVVTAALLDAVGRVVVQRVLPAGLATHTLPLTGLATGVYSLRLQTEAGIVVKKLVVE
ncbi:Ig-like domain-containing protein [Hymenobacter convexus]|uniref:Ig-like domain-containing protein n=1 Tax=Hymenobacter sp. CA1UV-4 TaxID=3063782 RepID=UPI0027122DD1|nr:Ig-like domain-containing protein [Hymenobacter sp. CA1UV-4]MDO7851417.1 Ig-like domain-containing protein [Hymenobacter sp. CA1UV-4]